ncbi:3'-5' exonuclease [Synechococcus sp. BA-132 BA5]|uniref:3'-5' exonuclease n=1 Tax=Synechococcus sp. BA-132 BA5 TaxID=3110252 RepID=UPI002B20032E|nr:exonuclease domain-containing protein [Synechococcus sp. BA-132 BA5]MEA5416006.1 exonuclease domain-containing protein [Synechococcus sp. BA-132 BA5]
MDFLVIDTEGAPILREVAVVDSHGELLLELHAPVQGGNYHSSDLVRPLPDLLKDLRSLLRGRRVVAHNASHDSTVLRASFEACGLNPPVLDWHCTVAMAQELHPALDSYALGALCDQLAVGSEPFSRDAAHQAAYDARFTYLLYRHLQRDQLSRRLSAEANPFSSSRVDTPFQSFSDDRLVNQAPFQRLAAVLQSVAADANRQSQGAVLIGDPGAGKTHLVMRLAQEVLQSNRLLFIRQPTQATSVLFHIYSRTLESLVEQVGDGPHSQLDLLLIRSIRGIFAEADTSTERDREILAALEAEDLSRLGQEGSDARRQRWERIEVVLLRWWAVHHGAAGFGRQILQGLLRFCRYIEPRRRESCRRWLATGEHEPVDRELEGLSPWIEEQLREEFSLQALRVIGQLCCLDQPLILVFDQLEGLWLEGNRPVLLRFGEVIKELFTHVPHALVLVTLFPDRWQQFQNDFDGSITGRVAQHVIQLEQPRPDQIEEILDLRLQVLGASARELFSSEEITAIARQSSIRSCINRAGAVFEHRVRGVPVPPPPPSAAVASHAADGLALNRRLLLVEQQLGQILQRLDRLEGIAPVSAPAINPAMPQAMETGHPPDAEGIPPAYVLEVAGTEPSIASDELNAYEALYLRYRTATLEVITERWQRSVIVDESDDAGKLKQICTGYQQIRSLRIGSLRLGNKRVPDNLLIESTGPPRCIAFLHVASANAITARLRNLNQLVMNYRQTQFVLMRDGFAPVIRSPGGMAAMEAFRNGSGDGRKRTFWRPLDHDNRVALEYVHQLVSDIVNRELDLPLPAGLELLASHDPDNWVVKLLHPA